MLGGTLTVRARAVVVAAGSIHSPALLRRSGLDNPSLGRRLYLHPTTAVYGRYAELVEPWEGVMQSRYSNEFADLDGRGYGVRLETAPAHPGLIGIAHRWRSGRQHKRLLSQSAYQANFIVLTRDRDPGRVTIDRAGRPVLHYQLSQYDGAHLRRGLRECFQLHVAAGALEIGSPHVAPEPFEAGGDLEAYLDGLDRLRFRTNAYMLFSAHQMGTCPMGGLRAESVVDPHGQSWDVRGLYVADASLFPTSSGVNPMITIMALAHRVAQTVKARLAVRA